MHKIQQARAMVGRPRVSHTDIARKLKSDLGLKQNLQDGSIDGQFDSLKNTDGELRLAIQHSVERVDHAKTAKLRELSNDK